MPTEFENRFDVADLLAFNLAKVAKDEHLGLENDESLILYWDIPYGAEQECVDWLYTNRIAFSNFDVGFKNYADLYRTVSITASQNRDRNGAITGSTVTHALGKGYYTSINWASARYVETKRTGTNTTTAGIDHTLSDAIPKDLIIEFPYCDPGYVDAMVLSLGSDDLPSVHIRGNDITGPWHILAIITKQADDKSHTIRVSLSRSTFTLKGYQDFLGSNEEEVVYVWRVPKTEAQIIADDWKAYAGAGSGASFSYNEDQALVDIVLRRKALSKPNLTISSIPVSCDSYQTMHFAWGYEKADIDAFISLHSGPLVSGTRQVRVDQRGDGLYDITIVETSVVAATPPHFAITTNIGNKISTYSQYGWNISYSQLVTVKASIQAIAEAANISVEFQVTRKDDCTFDYQARTTTKESNEGSLQVDNKVLLYGANALDKPAIADGLKLVGGSINPKEDGLIDYSLVLKDSNAPIVERANSGEDGVKVEVVGVVGGKIDDIDSENILSSGPRKRLEVSVRPQEDGTIDYGIVRQTVKKTEGSLSVRNKTILYGKNADKQPTIDDDTFLEGGSISPNDDGTIDYSLQTKTAPIEGQAVIDPDGEEGVGVSVRAVDSAKPEEIEANLKQLADTAGARERISIDLSPNNDGTISGKISKLLVQKVEGTSPISSPEPPAEPEWTVDSGDNSSSGNSGAGKSVVVKYGKNVSKAEFEDAVNSFGNGKNEKFSINVNPNDDGTVDYSITKTSLTGQQAWQYSLRKAWAFGGRQETITAPESAYLITGASASFNDDGTFDSSVQAEKLPYVVPGTLSYENGEYTEHIKSGFCKSLIEVPTYATTTRGKWSTDIQILIDDNGVIKYLVITRIYNIPSDFSDGVAVAFVGTYQKRQKVVRKNSTTLYLLNQRRLISKKTTRKYYLTQHETETTGEVESVSGRIGGIWYVDTTTVIIGTWESDPTATGETEVTIG